MDYVIGVARGSGSATGGGGACDVRGGSDGFGVSGLRYPDNEDYVAREAQVRGLISEVRRRGMMPFKCTVSAR